MTVARVRPFVAILAVAFLGAMSEFSRALAFAPGATVTATNAGDAR